MLDPTNARKAAERKARYRARQRAGIAVYRIEIGADVLDMLVRLRWLDDAEANNARQVSAALSALLRNAAKN